ncbi:hypothetical protein BpHYR1_048325 [Brachionus plicatilis]|uniref:Uncharacterized protein n=1 Tax=Brachionus plicatilis TaxID=10195 RepID=A0A3M7PEZ7_BRAPC|nr:hypothetical protein BpHYR1_048325 [Brachionus plicatilis]
MEVESFGFGSNDFCSANSLLFEQDQSLSESCQEQQLELEKDIFVCKVSYSAKAKNELTINFSDRLLVLNDKNKNLNSCYFFLKTGVVSPISNIFFNLVLLVVDTNPNFRLYSY